MTSFIAAGGSGRSVSFIPAFPAARSVTTIAFIVHLPVCGDIFVANRHQALVKRRPAMIQSHLTRSEVLVARVHRLEPAAVNGTRAAGDESPMPAHLHALPTGGADRRTVPGGNRDGLEV